MYLNLLRRTLKNGYSDNFMLCIFYNNLTREKVRNRGVVILWDFIVQHKPVVPWASSRLQNPVSDMWPHLLCFASTCALFTSPGSQPMAFPDSMMGAHVALPQQMAPLTISCQRRPRNSQPFISKVPPTNTFLSLPPSIQLVEVAWLMTSLVIYGILAMSESQ